MFLRLRFSCMGRCWVLDWECWELIFYVLSLDLLPPTHTTHTYTHIFGASFSVALGVVTSADVCVCSCRGRSQTIRRVCSLCASHFSISSFETCINNVFAVFSVLIRLRLRNITLRLYVYAVTLRPNTRTT